MESSYEDIRLANIRKNKELLAGLNISKLSEVIPIHAKISKPKPISTSTSLKSKFKKKPTALLVPVRSSLRLKGLQPDATPLPLSDLSPTTTSSSTTATTTTTTISNRVQAKPDQFSAQEAFLEGDQDILKGWSESKTPLVLKNETQQAKNVKTWFQSFQSFSGPVHLTPSRIYCMTFAPLESKIMACVGDKVGSLALWDLSNYVMDPSPTTSTSVCTFEPHSNVLAHVQFLQPHALATLSFDGTLRQLDLNHQTFSTLFQNDNDLETLHTLDQVDAHTVWISTGTGRLLQVDVRQKHLVKHLDFIHEKKCGCVMVNPLQPHVLLTSSNDRYLKWFDVRMDQILDQYQHQKSCTSGYFDHTSQRIVSTSYDNTLRVWQPSLTSSLSSSSSSSSSNSLLDLKGPVLNIPHSTQTGKWVTPFRAKWHPCFPETIVVANMNRHIDIYQSSTGKKICSLYDDTITAIPAVIGFHPSKPELLIAGNASGRGHIFTKDFSS